MEKRKKLLTILSTAIIVTAIFAPLLFVKTVAATDPTDWYTTVNGVLDSDTYLLYPYLEESLTVGFSKFGELINSNTNVGLEYAGARDPFAAPVGSSVDESKLPKKVWINGWYIDIRYVHEDWGPRNVWAGALFADKADYGKNWIRVDNNYTYPLSPQYEWQESFDDKGLELDEDLTPIPGLVNGGRKTNGTAVTEPITVLYDGPRLFVAKSETHIYDWNEDEDENLHLVDVVLTIMFNKVKKQVVVIKDVKFIDQAKYVIADLPITPPEGEETTIPMALLVQFSNREEWDLGAKDVSGTVDYSSYVHFYTAGTATNDAETEGQSTVYNNAWTMLPTLPANVTYDDVKINAWGPEPGADGTYDVAQIISNDELYVGWHAFWPSLSDWSADAARSTTKTWNRAMTASDPHWIDSYSGSEPFLSPLIVGEWDFILADREEEAAEGINIGRQFRGVSIYGVTDLNDGDDKQLGGSNNLDSEVLYQLNEIFNPWDLNDAVHKATKRWAEYTYGSTSYTTLRRPVHLVSDDEWDDHCTFSERVIDLTAGELLIRGVDYNITLDDDGYAVITGLDEDHEYKILYSTLPHITGQLASLISSTVTEINATEVEVNATTHSSAWTDWLGADHAFNVTFDGFTVHILDNSTSWEDTATLSLEWVESDFKVFVGETHISTIEDVTGPVNASVGDNEAWFEFDVGKLEKSITDSHDSSVTWPLDRETLHVLSLNHTLTVAVTVNVTAAEQGGNVTVTVTYNTTMTVDYEERLGGRYEWGIVGKNAHSVDSAGLSLVSAAFKNKQVEYGLAGADMYDPLPYNQMPWVMHKFGTDDELADYYYSGTDYRTALKDHWCNLEDDGYAWPISSSNMIGVGGPLANILAYYGNDFAQAIFGLDDFTDYADWEEVIIPLTCWDITKTQAYSSSNTTGYAVISTYKDINGTVLFLIWGHWGRDTYYASKWFHEEGIYQLQDAPDGLTAIILKIAYESTCEGYKPESFSIVECLGTISETEWTHDSETKGGFHDP